MVRGGVQVEVVTISIQIGMKVDIILHQKFHYLLLLIVVYLFRLVVVCFIQILGTGSILLLIHLPEWYVSSTGLGVRIFI